MLTEINCISVLLVLLAQSSVLCFGNILHCVVGASDGRGWLHMEVLEKDKMQWMTDVSLHPQPGEVGVWGSQ